MGVFPSKISLAIRFSCGSPRATPKLRRRLTERPLSLRQQTRQFRRRPLHASLMDPQIYPAGCQLIRKVVPGDQIRPVTVAVLIV